ncbi:hypothetical protein V6N12_036703 [Hibiscus sabdariffa]|uniref:Uncharacterized protein n=1 Tax=Hibiscus sabdariffa TaxID=183260 RepID=A0ABR2ERE9_9ROSI
MRACVQVPHQLAPPHSLLQIQSKKKSDFELYLLSSLGYLFGSGEAPKPAANNSQAASTEAPAVSEPVPAPAPQAADRTKQIPAGINSTSSNNYLRADGQNTGNFITDRPSTKVHAAPGGGSSLNYLFGGGPGDSK